MGVPSDAVPWTEPVTTTVRQPMALPLWETIDPYTGRDYREPSTLKLTEYVVPAGMPTEDDVRAALRELAHRDRWGTRWCPVCESDLSDVGAGYSLTPEGYKAATGMDRVASVWPQGGHAKDCPVVTLLRWVDGGESVYTRVRPD